MEAIFLCSVSGGPTCNFKDGWKITCLITIPKKKQIIFHAGTLEVVYIINLDPAKDLTAL